MIKGNITLFTVTFMLIILCACTGNNTQNEDSGNMPVTPTPQVIYVTAEPKAEEARNLPKKQINISYNTLVSGEPVSSGDRLTVVLCNENITLRAEPSSDSEAIDLIPLYSGIVFEYDCNNGFFKVSYRGKEGYVKSEYTDYFEPGGCSGSYEVVNCKEYLPLHNAASAEADEIIGVCNGETVYTVFNETIGDFVLVSYDGVSGWANKNYLRKIEPAGT